MCNAKGASYTLDKVNHAHDDFLKTRRQLMNKSLLALAMLTVSGTAMAQSPQWNKIEVSYLDATVDVGASEPSFDGWD